MKSNDLSDLAKLMDDSITSLEKVKNSLSNEPEEGQMICDKCSHEFDKYEHVKYFGNSEWIECPHCREYYDLDEI